MSNAPEPRAAALPRSLGKHSIPEDRADMIREHIAGLGETALQISDRLPFSADTSDFLRVLTDEAEDK